MGQQGSSARLRRIVISKLLLENISSLCMKWAETRDELVKIFRLVYEEYDRSGYIDNGDSSHMLFCIHHLLPETAVLLMKYNENIISTLSLVADCKQFGLPMDALYRDELDELREKDRKLMEACALATSMDYRWKNILAYLFRQAYWHAVNTGTDDLCIMVNPKHVQFYKTILLFEDFGGEKLYPRLGAPAVALKLNIDTYRERLRSAYMGYAPGCNLYSFFYENKDLSPEVRRLLFNMNGHNGVDYDVIKYFVKGLPQDQKVYFTKKWAEHVSLNQAPLCASSDLA